MGFESECLKQYHVIAVVGLSANPDRDSHRVAKYMKEHGYRIIPVNPGATELLGEKCYPDLVSVPDPIQIVDIFRRSEEVMPIVEQAIKIKAKVVWMQEGVINEAAAARSREAGLFVVMDKCIRKVHEQLANGDSQDREQ